MTDYAVGDIQGCYRELMEGLSALSFDPAHDRLWLTGDLVNRGPDSLATLKFLQRHQNSVRCVLGNHDLHLMAVARGHKATRDNDTLSALLADSDCDRLLDWLRRQPLCWHDAELGYTLVHAGIAPQWTLQQALSYAAEVEQVLQSEAIDDFLAMLYGNQPDCWQPELRGHDRLRCIVNYFTRMRVCDRNGRLDLHYKGTLRDIPADHCAWFDHPQRKTREHRIIFGHWAALGCHIDSKHKLFALDSGCAWGQSLTFLRLDNHQITVIPAMGGK